MMLLIAVVLHFCAHITTCSFAFDTSLEEFNTTIEATGSETVDCRGFGSCSSSVIRANSSSNLLECEGQSSCDSSTSFAEFGGSLHGTGFLALARASNVINDATSSIVCYGEASWYNGNNITLQDTLHQCYGLNSCRNIKNITFDGEKF